ncbi:hypothetical protein K0M31_005564 [Melipona bicolor]|uniref:Uncharacterized protein n=1 Tax=Melipona bicolor TaxID=60889 RepID=A0AA40FV97_9HYME|nr:hypothetical protein K0M31_005564 [Melipona bicolor]
MDIGTSVSNNQNASSAQRKFYQWVLKWITGIHAQIDWDNDEMRDTRHSTKPDVPTLASFLQAIGFKLLSFETYNDPLVSEKNDNKIETSEQGVLRVAIECNISNMRAVLELGGIACKCPNPDHIKDASFWSISGTRPVGSTDNISQKVVETGSTLLPRLSKDVVRLLRDVSHKLFDIIVYDPNVNRNTDILNASQANNVFYEHKVTKEIRVTRSHTEPEMCLRTDDMTLECSPERRKSINSNPFISHDTSPIQSSKPTLERQKTWDIETESLDEPRPSPPKLASSPTVFSELSTSLEKISLQSVTNNPRNITEYILGAHQNLEKALEVLLVKKPKLLNEISPIQDNDGTSVRSVPANIPSVVIASPCHKPIRSNTVTTIKSSSKLSCLMREQQTQAKTNPAIIPRVRRNIEPMLSKSRKNVKSEQENVKPTLRRSSFYIPSSATSNTSLLKPSDVGQKFSSSRKCSTSKANVTISSNLSSSCKDLFRTKKFASPEQASSNSETLKTTSSRISMIKPPTKISKTAKPTKSTKTNPEIKKNSRVGLLKE